MKAKQWRRHRGMAKAAGKRGDISNMAAHIIEDQKRENERRRSG